MRAIEFRGKSLQTGEWVYGGYYSQDDCRKGDRRHVIVWENKGPGMGVIHEPVDHETVGQRTGLKDNNGTDIYEGDVVKADIYGKEFAGLVQYSQGLGLYYLSDMARSDTELWICEEKEVVGNIHDNPELLEVE